MPRDNYAIRAIKLFKKKIGMPFIEESMPLNVKLMTLCKTGHILAF
jgi:hypothetical protein